MPTYSVTIDGDLSVAAHSAGWDWAEVIWERTSPEERKAIFPRTAEQSHSVPVRYRRGLTNREAVLVAHFVHEAAQQKWTELHTGRQSDGAEP